MNHFILFVIVSYCCAFNFWHTFLNKNKDWRLYWLVAPNDKNKIKNPWVCFFLKSQILSFILFRIWIWIFPFNELHVWFNGQLFIMFEIYLKWCGTEYFHSQLKSRCHLMLLLLLFVCVCVKCLTIAHLLIASNFYIISILITQAHISFM